MPDSKSVTYSWFSIFDDETQAYESSLRFEHEDRTVLGLRYQVILNEPDLAKDRGRCRLIIAGYDVIFSSDDFQQVFAVWLDKTCSFDDANIKAPPYGMACNILGW